MANQFAFGGTGVAGLADGTTKPLVNDGTGCVLAVSTGAPSTTAGIYQPGCICIRTSGGSSAYNAGTLAVPLWVTLVTLS